MTASSSDKINKMSEILRAIETTKNTKSFEFSVNGLSYHDREDLRYSLMSKGMKAEFYTECRKQLLGVWLS
jgi:hypothetical protein